MEKHCPKSQRNSVNKFRKLFQIFHMMSENRNNFKIKNTEMFEAFLYYRKFIL